MPKLAHILEVGPDLRLRKMKRYEAGMCIGLYRREKEGELATTSLEFEYLHRKSRCEMLIGGDDISNDVITLGVCFHVFSNASLHSPSFPLRADWRKSDSSVDGEPQVNWRRNAPSGDVVASSPSFSCPASRAPRRAYSQVRQLINGW